jgi:hypothetical protein
MLSGLTRTFFIIFLSVWTLCLHLAAAPNDLESALFHVGDVFRLQSSDGKFLRLCDEGIDAAFDTESNFVQRCFFIVDSVKDKTITLSIRSNHLNKTAPLGFSPKKKGRLGSFSNPKETDVGEALIFKELGSGTITLEAKNLTKYLTWVTDQSRPNGPTLLEAKLASPGPSDYFHLLWVKRNGVDFPDQRFPFPRVGERKWWVGIPGTADTLGAGGQNHVFTTHKGAPAISWTQDYGLNWKFLPTQEGVPGDKRVVFDPQLADRGKNGWVEIANQYRGKGLGIITSIDVGPHGEPFVTNDRKELFYHDGGHWRQLPSTVKAERVAIGYQGQPYIIDANDHSIKRWDPGKPTFRFEKIAGQAYDIAVTNDAVFIIGTEEVHGGYQCKALVNNQWKNLGGGGIRITPGDQGLPFIVNNVGSILQFHTNVGGFIPPTVARQTHWPKAEDLACGPNGNNMIIVSNEAVEGGFQLYNFGVRTDLPGKQHMAIPISRGNAIRVGVDGNGDFWQITDRGEVRRRTNIASNDWFSVPDIWGYDITFASSTPFLLGNKRIDGRENKADFALYRYVDKEWQELPMQGIAIAGNANGECWVVNSDREIFRGRPAPPEPRWVTIKGAHQFTELDVDSQGTIYALDNGGKLLTYLDNGDERAQWKTAKNAPTGLVDISIGGQDTLWLIGQPANGGNYQTYRKIRETITQVAGAGTSLAVDTNGRGWVTLSNGAILRSNFIDPLYDAAKAYWAHMDGVLETFYQEMRKVQAKKEQVTIEKAKELAEKQDAERLKKEAEQKKAEERSRDTAIKKEKEYRAKLDKMLESSAAPSSSAIETAKKNLGGDSASMVQELKNSLGTANPQQTRANQTVPNQVKQELSQVATRLETSLTSIVNPIKLNTLAGFAALPFSDQITIRDVAFHKKTLNGAQLSFVTGRASFFGLTDAQVFGGSQVGLSGEPLFFFAFPFDTPWTLTNHYGNKIPAEIRDLLSFKKGLLCLSSNEGEIEYDDFPEVIQGMLRAPFDLQGSSPEFSLELKRGLNVHGKIGLDGSDAFQIFSTIFPVIPREVLVWGVLTENVKNLSLRANLGRLRMPSFFPASLTPGETVLEVTGAPAIGIKFLFDLRLPGEDEDNKFYMGVKKGLNLKINPVIDFSGGMEGEWTSPFGISGLSIGNVCIGCKIPLPFTGTNSPTLKLGGLLRIGSKVIEMSALIPPKFDPLNTGLRGTVNELSLFEIVRLAETIGLNNLPIEKLPIDRIALKDVEINLASKDDADLNQKQGITIKGKLNLIAENLGDIEITVDVENGIIGKGSLKKIDFGPPGATLFSLNGDGGKGPSFDLQLNLREQHCFITGKVNILGLSKMVKIALEPSGMKFHTEDSLFNAFEAILDVVGSFDVRNPDFQVRASLKADFIGKAIGSVNAVIGGRIPFIVQKAFSQIFAIHNAGFQVGLRDLLSGEIPRLDIDITILGAGFNLHPRFNLRDPLGSMKSLGSELGQAILDKIGDFAKRLLEYAKQAIEAVGKAAIAAAEKTYEAGKIAAEATARAAQVAAEATAQAAEAVADWTENAAKDSWNWTQNAAETGVNAIGKGLETGATGILKGAEVVFGVGPKVSVNFYPPELPTGGRVGNQLWNGPHQPNRIPSRR